VLSTCDGAAADVLPGEEILSLSWGFLAAGASGVLASLWPVDDQSALRFMETFYDSLSQRGDPGLALAHTQRTLIKTPAGENDPISEPVNWAGLVFTGASHRLD
jgi:CHAT domain-containing protein